MILTINVILKKEGVSTEAFRDYMLNVRAPLIKAMPEVVRYEQNFKLLAQTFSMPSTGQDMDVIEVMHFENHDIMDEVLAGDAYKAVIATEGDFVGNLQVLTCDHHLVQPIHYEKPLVKRISFITRHPAIDFDKFKYEWYVTHCEFVEKMVEVEGYRQNLVLERYSKRGRAASRQEVRIDGMVELYFETPELLAQAFGSENGIRSNWHTRTCIKEVTPFLVEEHIIK